MLFIWKTCSLLKPYMPDINNLRMNLNFDIDKRRMRKHLFITLLCSLFLISCSQDEWEHTTDVNTPEIVFKLYNQEYDDMISRQSTLEESRFDRLEYYIVDENGNRIQDTKSSYDPSAAEIHIEGLHEGNYRLLVLGIKGDENRDKATIHKLENINDTWLEFPDDLQKPLDAEYFYSQTPFAVTVSQGENGQQEIATIRQDIKQRRIFGRVDFSFAYNNPYIRTAAIENKVTFQQARFYTTISGSGSMSGESNGMMQDIVLNDITSYNFMPLAEGTVLEGKIDMLTRNYRGGETEQTYTFSQHELEANHIHRIETKVTHPDDKSAMMFITRSAYAYGQHDLILQDDETKDVYTNPAVRKFNTAQPLQVTITDDGRLHVRFYSPRNLQDVLIKACVPAISNEYFDLAYFDSIPGFADFYEPLTLTQRKSICRIETGRQVEVPKMNVSDLDGTVFKIESTDPFWAKLTKIEHGWDIYWGLYGGNPDLEDGGPVGNWMGIRPVHCRESVAIFLNFTYMIDMPEHERILTENADKLYDDNKQPIKVEKVLQQMRQKRTLQVGLVYPGHGIIGLGGGTTFGAYQQAWFEHYWNTYSCSIMFHELGHVMGYGHSSSFTYGPWAEELMNNFYVQNISQFPIDSPDYLNSRNNPHRYK